MKKFRPNTDVNAPYEWPILDWNNSWKSAAQFLFAQSDHEKLRHFFIMMKSLQTKQHKTQSKNIKKSHTNQLISGKFCSLPATTTCPSPLLAKIVVLVWVSYLQSSRPLQRTPSSPLALTVFFLALRQGPEFDSAKWIKWHTADWIKHCKFKANDYKL